MYVVLIGPPGSGKGTQSKMMFSRLGFYHFAVGDLLRRNRDNPEIKKSLEQGQLVRSSVIIKLLGEHLEKLNGDDIVFDGIPRSYEQVRLLSSCLERMGKKLDLVIGIDVPSEEIVARITSRRCCTNCGEIYNLLTNPTSSENICDKCGSPLFVRDDDNKDTILKRLSLYEKETKPLIDYYHKEGIYKRIEASGKPMEDVFKDISSIVESSR